MTIVPADDAGLRLVQRELDAGAPVVLALPMPLPYAVVGIDASAVNTAKGRPAEQPAGLWLADLAMATPHLALDERGAALARWLSAVAMANLLLPALDEVPDWMRPGTSDGWFAATLPCLPRVRPLLLARGHLYASSANTTGGAVAVTSADADAAFAGALPVLDCDDVRDTGTPSGSAVMLRVLGESRVEVVRRGITDAPFGGDENAYLTDLLARWAVAA